MATDDGAPAESDSALLVRVRAGDDAGFAELYRRHEPAVRRYARLCCRDAHTAEDLTAEVFARTLRAVRAGGGPRTAVRAYLLTMVRRAAAQWGADGALELPVAEPGAVAPGAPGDSQCETGTIARAERSMVVRAFLSLPERWQEVLWRTAVDGEPVRQVARRLGLTSNATAVLAHRAREGLRAAYLQAHVGDSLTGQEECRRYASRLGAYARRPYLRRGYLGLRRHLAGCDRCRSAFRELADLNETLRGVLPLVLAGWFAVSGIAGTAELTGKAAGTAGAGAEGLAGAGGPTGGGGLLSKVTLTATVALAAATATGSAPLTGQLSGGQERGASQSQEEAARDEEGAARSGPEAHDRDRKPAREDRDGPADSRDAPSPTPEPPRSQVPAPAHEGRVAPEPAPALDANPGVDLTSCASGITESLSEAVDPSGECASGSGTLAPPRPFDGQDPPDLPSLPPFLQAPGGAR